MSSKTGAQVHRRTWLWPTLIIGMLAFHTVGLILVAIVASSDPSFSVEPNYYEKALAWDASREEKRDPQTDGYSITSRLSALEGDYGHGELVLSIERDNLPMTGLDIGATIFHIGRADDRQELVLQERAPGEYVGRAVVRRDGRWEARYRVNLSERTYAFARRMEVYGATR